MRTVSLLLTLMVPSMLVADEVFLKSAGKISGRIVSRTDNEVQVDVGAGTVTVLMSRVDRLVEGHTALHKFAARAAALSQATRMGGGSSHSGLPRRESIPNHGRLTRESLESYPTMLPPTKLLAGSRSTASG